jgi:fructose-specific PTS system IIA-like component
MPVGAMLEVPAAAFLLDALCRELDFFSIGSNDLLQYFAAADRSNARVERLQDRLQPAFLRLLKKIVDDVHTGGKWVGLCGEMGAQPACLPLLVGLGLQEISVVPPMVAAVKSELATWTLPACRELLHRALGCASARSVHQLVEATAAQRPVPIIDPELILVESEGSTKAEAIKEAVDRLYVVGRTEQPRLVEQAVWEREAVYSTGFGYGFAIPHCKTSAVTANSIVLLKLRTPIHWGSLDDQPVRVILLLAIRESEQSDAHMKIFSRLARRVMHDTFREHLVREQVPATLCAFLEENLNL